MIEIAPYMLYFTNDLYIISVIILRIQEREKEVCLISIAVYYICVFTLLVYEPN